jgi:hypothetical protein
MQAINAVSSKYHIIALKVNLLFPNTRQNPRKMREKSIGSGQKTGGTK